MIFQAVAIAVAVLIAVVTCQRLIDKYSKDNESMRKFIHVLHGLIIAGLTLFTPLSVVIVVEVFFLISMFVARYLYQHFYRLPWVKYLGRVYKVGRVSYGDFFFPISVIACVFIANSKWELAIAVLILGLADAVAALVGKRLGRSNSYKIFGQKKSIVGSTAFFFMSIAIMAVFVWVSPVSVLQMDLLAVIGVCLLATATENLGVYGSDNLLIPLVVVLALNRF